AAMTSGHQSDCEEKRDPDERQTPRLKKENKLDRKAQLEKLPFVGSSLNEGSAGQTNRYLQSLQWQV
ncbi:hypothetical protein, partial [Roseobacter weihaiensis]|uniref:hypothetical protein n=1 Tax=Roseobacter weihaiensis TaxID=2763262 RepID=UPI001D0AEDC0